MKSIYRLCFLWLATAFSLCSCREAPRTDAGTPKPQAEASVQPTGYIADTFLTCTAAPMEIRLFWKDSDGHILGSLGAVRRYAEQSGETLRFAMNAGMYTEDQQPLGLFVEKGETVRRLNRDTGYGNFYLRPNGIFYITESGTADVCSTPDFPAKKGVRWATQSGPMLLINGRAHPAFKQGSLNLNIRNGVGILPNGQVLFAIATVPVNLWDFAQAFKARGCRNALYLDGAISRAYFPEGGLEDTGGAFGVMIGVLK